MPRVLPFFGPLARLAQAAAQLPGDWSSEAQDIAWYTGMATPMGELTALIASTVAGPPVVGEVSCEEVEREMQALGLDTHRQNLVAATAGVLVQALEEDGPVKLAAPHLEDMAKAAAIDPTMWLTIVQMVLTIIDEIRKRRNPQPQPA